MNSPARVFIAEMDEPKLLMLSLYLEQFDDIEIVGTAFNKSDLDERIRKQKPDVIIYSDCSATERWSSLICRLKNREHCPALVCIREGNFLPLEGVFNRTPEALLPSFTTVDSLIETIRRSAEAFRRQSVATPIKNASSSQALSAKVLPKAG